MRVDLFLYDCAIRENFPSTKLPNHSLFGIVHPTAAARNRTGLAQQQQQQQQADLSPCRHAQISDSLQVRLNSATIGICLLYQRHSRLGDSPISLCNVRACSNPPGTFYPSHRSIIYVVKEVSVFGYAGGKPLVLKFDERKRTRGKRRPPPRQRLPRNATAPRPGTRSTAFVKQIWTTSSSAKRKADVAGIESILTCCLHAAFFARSHVQRIPAIRST